MPILASRWCFVVRPVKIPADQLWAFLLPCRHPPNTWRQLQVITILTWNHSQVHKFRISPYFQYLVRTTRLTQVNPTRQIFYLWSIQPFLIRNCMFLFPITASFLIGFYISWCYDWYMTTTSLFRTGHDLTLRQYHPFASYNNDHSCRCR